MNALVTFRSNGAGTLSLRPEQRKAAQEDIQSNFLARLRGIQRALAQQAGAKSTGPTAVTAASTAKTDATSPPTNELDRDAFLRLLIQQMTNQDPLEPVNNEDMIAQLAQFSSLEQMENLNNSFEEMTLRFDSLNGNIDQLNFISAQGMLGKFVEGVAASGEVISGTVESVHLDGSIVMLTVDGETMPMSGVIGIADRQPESAPGNTAQ